MTKVYETPRQRQMRFRYKAKTTIGCIVFALIPYLMIAHWIIAGY